mgnify:FL=1
MSTVAESKGKIEPDAEGETQKRKSPDMLDAPKYGVVGIALSKLARDTMSVSASKEKYPGDAEGERGMAEMIREMGKTQGHIAIDAFRAYDEDTDDKWKMYYHIIQMSAEGAKKMGSTAATVAMTVAAHEGWNLVEVVKDLQAMVLLEDRTDKTGINLKWLPPETIEAAKTHKDLVLKDGYGKPARPWVMIPLWRLYAGLPDINKVLDVETMQRNAETQMLDEMIAIAAKVGVNIKMALSEKKVKTEDGKQVVPGQRNALLASLAADRKARAPPEPDVESAVESAAQAAKLMANHDLVHHGLSTAVQMGAERVGCSSDALKRASEKVTMKDGKIAFEGLSQEEAMAMKGLMDQIGFKGVLSQE